MANGIQLKNFLWKTEILSSCLLYISTTNTYFASGLLQTEQRQIVLEKIKLKHTAQIIINFLILIQTMRTITMSNDYKTKQIFYVSCFTNHKINALHLVSCDLSNG